MPLAQGCNFFFRRALCGFFSRRRVTGSASCLVAAMLLVLPVARAAGLSGGTSDGVSTAPSTPSDGQRGNQTEGNSGNRGTVYVPVWTPPMPDLHPEWLRLDQEWRADQLPHLEER